MKAELRYWDSDSFLGWLNKEPDKVKECREVLYEAEKRKIILVTSALTLTEVIKVKNRNPIKKENAKKIKDFLKQSYVSVRNVDRVTAEKARELIWDYPVLQPKDSIHIATALRIQIPILNTFDEGLLNLDGLIGDPPYALIGQDCQNADVSWWATCISFRTDSSCRPPARKGSFDERNPDTREGRPGIPDAGSVSCNSSF